MRLRAAVRIAAAWGVEGLGREVGEHDGPALEEGAVDRAAALAPGGVLAEGGGAEDDLGGAHGAVEVGDQAIERVVGDLGLVRVRAVDLADEVEEEGVEAAEGAVLLEVAEVAEGAEAEGDLAVGHAALFFEGVGGGEVEGGELDEALEERAGGGAAHAVADLLGGERGAAGVDPAEDVELDVVGGLGLDDVDEDLGLLEAALEGDVELGELLVVEGLEVLEIAEALVLLDEAVDGGEALDAVDDLHGALVILVEIEGGQGDPEEDRLDEAGALEGRPDEEALEVGGEVDVAVVDHVDDLAEGEGLGADPDLGGIPGLGVRRGLVGLGSLDLDVGGLVVEELLAGLLVGGGALGFGVCGHRGALVTRGEGRGGEDLDG
jgi:hypothetical protein